MKFKKLFLTVSMSLALLAGMMGGASVAADTKLTWQSVSVLNDKQLDDLTLQQITEINTSLAGLGQKDLAAIGQDTWAKINKLWQREGDARSLSQLENDISNAGKIVPIPIGVPSGILDVWDPSFLYNANWGQYSGGGSLVYDWDSSYVTASNRNNVWAEASVYGYGWADASTGVTFATTYPTNEAHEISLTFDGWTGWTVWANPSSASFGSMDVKGYLYDVTNGNWVVNGLSLYSSTGIIYSDDETFHNSTTTTLWGGRTYLAFVTSHITATASTLDPFSPGYCVSQSETSSDHTYWSSIGLYWLN